MDLGATCSASCSDQPSKPYVVCVEGNIGCGKSTMMEYFKNCSDSVEVVPEPLEKWTNLNGHNALAKLYEDSERWGFAFNLYAALTRLQMHSTVTTKRVVLLERSLYSLRYCFVEADYQCGKINSLDYSIINEWFEYSLSQNLVNIDLFVYLRVDPKLCYERLKLRNRKEETTVPYSLLEGLHAAHESMLIDRKFPLPAKVLVVDGNVAATNMESIFDQLKSQMLFQADS
ncbi:thymidine kinase 2, mitochondrial-like isoform X2 [Watersipora subatra]|uniref:thymidine kinase 2, mitochondrial-like isoform X2 n=1 Tax=Watersipora subatra TaxID=2589382 RepID=UPI00355B860E